MSINVYKLEIPIYNSEQLCKRVNGDITMASVTNINGQMTESYSDTGAELHVVYTLGTAGTETLMTLPNTAKGFRIRPTSYSVIFAVTNTSTARTAVYTGDTGSGTTYDFASGYVGGYAYNDEWTTRLLPAYNGTDARKLSLKSATGSVVVVVEVF